MTLDKIELVGVEYPIYEMTIALPQHVKHPTVAAVWEASKKRRRASLMAKFSIRDLANIFHGNGSNFVLGNGKVLGEGGRKT